MYLLHGTWLPGAESDFENDGRFSLWVETDNPPTRRTTKDIHPRHLSGRGLDEFFSNTLPLSKPLLRKLRLRQTPLWFTFPSDVNGPLPSLEMARYLGLELPERLSWKQWQLHCLQSYDSLALLKEVHFQTQHYRERVMLGADLLFWYRYSRALRELIIKHQFIPALFPRTPKPRRGRRQAGSPDITFEPGWQILSPHYAKLIDVYARAMPGVCRAITAKPSRDPARAGWYEADTLLRHYSEQTVTEIVTCTGFTQQQQRAMADTFVEACLDPTASIPISTDTWRQWASWRQQLVEVHETNRFVLGFRLHSAAAEGPDDWFLQWLAISRKDPSLQVPLEDYWAMKGAQRNTFHRHFGADFQQVLLLQLGQAARMYPRLWEGMNHDRPSGLTLDRTEALAFLKDNAWVLEEAGYKVSVPAWWTPEGRQRAQLRLRMSSRTGQESGGTMGYFSLPGLIQFRYELAIDGQPVSEQEWRELVEAKSELVYFRGQWIELDHDKMASLLHFWQSQKDVPQQMSLAELMQRSAGEDGDYEFSLDDTLTQMMARLQDKRHMDPLDTPEGLCGELREYQKRGLSWLSYLESLGMGPCLADDMGLGKTIQVIALLVQERKEAGKLAPTLLIAPTSVLGNWHRELHRFAPQIQVLIHHGPRRATEPAAFAKACWERDMIITSYALVRRDARLLNTIDWHRIVVDEAQNIKNPKSAQTRAIIKLQASHRLALTGTPIENRLLDLWSIFRFLNPGYLSTIAQFKKTFETPIQREEDPVQAQTLKRLVEPFILRRMKTDKAILKDLPDKIEQKVYCNLTQEQATLYEAVVREAEKIVEESEGMQRRGLILSVLMRLKQICNHPAQFLRDGSEFSAQRSHKLARITDMVEEALSEGESLLLFTQFTDIGESLEKYFRENYHYPTYYLHGGTGRAKRERMIDEFQDPDSAPAIFILSLKAGGVGINLTRANHVFHFDRWWNPAVENQATDRAFRIGQRRNVFVHKMVAIGTLEERIDQMLEEKQRLSESVMGSDESWLTELNNDAFRELITLNRNAILE
jgi:SNF2 family DNA or RNA helicase